MEGDGGDWLQAEAGQPEVQPAVQPAIPAPAETEAATRRRAFARRAQFVRRFE